MPVYKADAIAASSAGKIATGWITSTAAVTGLVLRSSLAMQHLPRGVCCTSKAYSSFALKHRPAWNVSL